MKPRVYVETSVVSYLVASPSRGLVVAAHQPITQTCWQTRRAGFDLYTSRIVLEESRAGNPEAAAHRLQALRSLPILELTPEARDLAGALMQQELLPEKAVTDALHIAVAVVIRYGLLDYLELRAHCECISPEEDRITLSDERL